MDWATRGPAVNARLSEERELDGQTTCDAHKLPPDEIAYEPGRSQNVRESVPPQLRFPEVPGTRTVSQIELAIDDARIRRSSPRLFCVPGQREPAPKRRFALGRRLELALLEIQRRKPPHVASLERHGDGRIQNRRRAIPISQPAVGLGEQRQVVRPARLRAVSVEPLERRLDDLDAFGGLAPVRAPTQCRTWAQSP